MELKRKRMNMEETVLESMKRLKIEDGEEIREIRRMKEKMEEIEEKLEEERERRKELEWKQKRMEEKIQSLEKDRKELIEYLFPERRYGVVPSYTIRSYFHQQQKKTLEKEIPSYIN
jgi:predicted  nucleic acid-binding Zn-ribbon protein